MGYWMKFHTSRHGFHTSRGHLKKKFIPKIVSFIPKNIWFIPQNLCFIPRKNHGYLMMHTGYWVLGTGALDITASSDWLIDCRMTTLITQCFDWMHSFNTMSNWLIHRLEFLNRRSDTDYPITGNDWQGIGLHLVVIRSDWCWGTVVDWNMWLVYDPWITWRAHGEHVARTLARLAPIKYLYFLKPQVQSNQII